MTIDVRDYDLATFYRFKLFFENCHWFNDPQLPITEIRNDHIYRGKRIEFPLIALRRVATPIMYKDAQNSWATGRTGDRRGRDISIAPDMSASVVDMTMVQTNYELKYMLEIFSFERDNFDELVVEVQENLFRYPYLTFENWKNKDLRMLDPQVAGISTNLTWESTEDNTDLENFNSQTPFYRATITFTLRAYIYRKYTALLVEDIVNGYRVLDYNKVVQQVIDSAVPIIPPEDPDYPTPPDPPAPSTGDAITLDTIASEDTVGSIGVFLYTEPGNVKPYGSIISGAFLRHVSIAIPESGELNITKYDTYMTGKWKLLCVAKPRTEITPCIVLAVKIEDDSDSTDDSRDDTGNSSNDNNDTGDTQNDNKIGYLNTTHTDQEVGEEITYILISEDNQYILYDSTKDYTIVAISNSVGETTSLSSTYIAELIDYEGKLALKVTNLLGNTLSVYSIEYKETPKRSLIATDLLNL